MATVLHAGRGPARARTFARLCAIVVLAGMLSFVLPAVAPDTPLPSPTTVTAAEGARTDTPSAPVRVRVPSIGIDLPVVSENRRVPGNRAGYPLCDVAQYLDRFDQPGAPGTTWIYAHAQEGMFLPLFLAAESQDLLGKVVEVQTRDGRSLRYRIKDVKRRAAPTDYRIAKRDRRNEHRVVLQTSTGPPGTDPKLQVAATLISAEKATEPAPRAKPRACWQPKPTPTKKPRNGSKATPTPEPVEVIEDGGSVDTMTLAIGSAIVLLGATLVAVYLARRGP